MLKWAGGLNPPTALYWAADGYGVEAAQLRAVPIVLNSQCRSATVSVTVTRYYDLSVWRDRSDGGNKRRTILMY